MLFRFALWYLKERYWWNRYSDRGLGDFASHSYLDRYRDFYYSLPNGEDNPKFWFFESTPDRWEIAECYERDEAALKNHRFWGNAIAFHDRLFIPIDWLACWLRSQIKKG